MSETCYAGIDVSSATLTLVILDAARQPSAAQDFANTPAGQRRILQRLRALATPVHVCLEPTSCYHSQLCWLLNDAADVTLSLIPPRCLRAFAHSLGLRPKTDPLDAAVLALYGAALRPAAWIPPSALALELRSLARRLADLVQRATALKNQHHSAQRAALSRAVVRDIEQELAANQRRQVKLIAAAQQLIDADEQLSVRCVQLQSVPGIAAKTAQRLLAELAVLPPQLGKKQWVAVAGLDPVPHESGSSVHSKRHISKQGNCRLRQALLLPALCAVRHCPQVKAYYERLLKRGVPKLAAICAVMRKLLQAIWGMFNTGTTFNPQLFTPLDT